MGTITAACLAVVLGTSAVLGWGLVFVVDALFVLAVGLFAIAVILTRPSVSRRRAVEEATEETDSDDRHDVRKPAGQLRTGIRLALVATTLLCVSFLVQYGVL
ncbi:hypothetical protein [Natronobacterium texcoconense]|uniref:hypothetical protein n=1 Tax=Natronobacterium texcoconense TaxID=1095778 RepID=UPI0011145A1B|nr:hypothetical protein [Natronobacterium texcoconense]